MIICDIMIYYVCKASFLHALTTAQTVCALLHWFIGKSITVINNVNTLYEYWLNYPVINPQVHFDQAILIPKASLYC